VRILSEVIAAKSESKYQFGFGTKFSHFKFDMNCNLNPKIVLSPPKNFSIDVERQPLSLSYKYTNLSSHSLKAVLDQKTYRLSTWASLSQRTWNMYSEVMIPRSFIDHSGQIIYGIGAGTGSKGPIGSLRATYCFNKKNKDLYWCWDNNTTKWYSLLEVSFQNWK